MMRILFERSSAIVTTLPRIMPRSASETVITSEALFAGACGWFGWPGRRKPPRSGRLYVFGCCAGLFAGPLPFFSCSFIDSCTIESMTCFTSVAFAYLIWMYSTTSVTGLAMSIAFAISRMRLMICSVSVTRIEFVRSKTRRMPLLDLKPSNAFCASSIAMFLNGIISDTTRVDSPSFASGSIMSGMPSLRTSLRGIARTNFSPYGSMWMPFISRTVSIASIFSSTDSSCPFFGCNVIVAAGTCGSFRTVFSTRS